jgi:hypothetical protein
MIETAAIRLARPSRDLGAAERFYVEGVGLDVLWRGGGHGPGEHDILMLGWRRATWHLELVATPRQLMSGPFSTASGSSTSGRTSHVQTPPSQVGSKPRISVIARSISMSRVCGASTITPACQ